MPRMRARILVLFLLALACDANKAKAKVGPVPNKVRARLGLDPFYKKHLDAGGLPIVSSAKVPDEALDSEIRVDSHFLHTSLLITSLESLFN